MLPVRKVFVAYLRWQSPKTYHDGIVISTWDSKADHPALASKVLDALELIRRVDYRRYARLRRDVGRITLDRLQVAGTFVPSAGGVFLDTSHVELAHVAELALTIVHEATHARIHRAGVKVDARVRSRVEHVCIGAEIDLAAKLGPKYSTLIDAAVQKRASANWSDAERFERRVRGLREAGLPSWFVRAYVSLFRP